MDIDFAIQFSCGLIIGGGAVVLAYLIGYKNALVYALNCLEGAEKRYKK